MQFCLFDYKNKTENNFSLEDDKKTDMADKDKKICKSDYATA